MGAVTGQGQKRAIWRNKIQEQTMARPRKPPTLHLVQGTHRKDRHGPLPSPLSHLAPLGPPPADWKPDGKALWNELAAQIPLGVATKGDRLAFETLCRLVMRMRVDIAPTPALASQIKSFCLLFGLTPTSRALLAQPPEQDSPLDEYTRRE
jgi:hypothetical protein